MPRFASTATFLGLSLSTTLFLQAATPPAGEPAIDTLAASKLLEKNDCRACHQPKENLAGPSYFAIADRLRYDKAKIAAAVLKVQKGSNGKTTYPGLKTSIAIMNPHPQLSAAEIETLIRYMILESDWTPETAKDPAKK
jgi:cytochrome c551/c552